MKTDGRLVSSFCTLYCGSLPIALLLLREPIEFTLFAEHSTTVEKYGAHACSVCIGFRLYSFPLAHSYIMILPSNLRLTPQKAESTEKVPASTDDLKKAALEQRRCILLAIVGATPGSSPSLERVLSDGYLSSVKSWLDDILTGSVGELIVCNSPQDCTFSSHPYLI